MCRTIQGRDNSKQEGKWHEELSTILSVPFWDACHHFVDRIKNNNILKYFQYQILRGSLKTNAIVCHFVAIVPATCSFGCQMTETCSHLFWHCQHSAYFWTELRNLFNVILNIPTTFSVTEVLFGDHHQATDSVKNTLMLVGKKYIWVQKFRRLIPSLIGFIKYLLQYLETLKVVYCIKNKTNIFDDQWNNTVVCLQDYLSENEPPGPEDAPP